MAIEKPSLNNFLPNGFETQDKDGYKVNFDSDKIATGFDKDTLEILSGPNLNNLLDKTGKNFNTLEQFLTFFRDMPIGSFPITNASNQLDYKSVNSFFRNVGELVFSAIPLEDGNLRLLDGSLLEYTMTYSRFITYIAGLRASLPNLFCTQAEFDQSLATYGVCGKFVYDTVTKSLRLPKISGFIKGTLDSGSLGDVDEAKAPQHSHTATTTSNGAHKHDRGTMEITGSASFYSGLNGASGAFQFYSHGGNAGSGAPASGNFDFQASRTWTGETSQNGAHTHNVTVGDANNSVFKAGNANEPQAIKEFIYIVVSIDEAEKQVLSAVYNYKGSVENYSDLPTAVAIGEVYNVIGEDPEGYSGANFAWTGEEWDRLGGTVNLSGYLTKTEAQNTYATKASLESNVEVLQQQINTNASNISNIASQEVIDAGIRKIEMLKFASTLGAGKVADTDMYSVIKKYKYSSFDSSKFTTSGGWNGTITKDGIASGFTNVTYINPLYSFSNITTNFHLENVANTRILGGSSKFIYNISNVFESGFNYLNKLYLKTVNTDAVIGTKVFSNNTNYKFVLDFNGTRWLFQAYLLDGTLYDSITLEDNTPISTSSYLMVGSNGSGSRWQGSIDLKTLKLFVDGVEVFNGRNEGMDILKADDFKAYVNDVENSNPSLPFSNNGLIITKDGIVSGFSTSNRILTSSNLLQVGKKNVIKCPYRKTNVTSNTEYIFSINFGGQRQFAVAHRASGKIKIDYTDGLTDYLSETNFAPTIGINYILTMESDFKTYLKLYADSNLIFTTVFNYTLTLSNGTVKLGVNTTNGFPLNNGSLDLNAFKIYVDGDLVYQPLLRIPYTLSNTGLKITDKLDRAIDMAEQCGFSDYFGLDEDNLLCLVPQGDNITGRRELISRVEDSVTHYVTEIYSDLYCKQMGSGTASTAVTLNIPYKDANYKLSVPQNAKSKTGFTPTASCDWTAEGYIYLDEVI